MSHEGGYSTAVVPYCGLPVFETLAGHRTEVVDPWAAYIGGWGHQTLQPHQSEAMTVLRQTSATRVRHVRFTNSVDLMMPSISWTWLPGAGSGRGSVAGGTWRQDSRGFRRSAGRNRRFAGCRRIAMISWSTYTRRDPPLAFFSNLVPVAECGHINRRRNKWISRSKGDAPFAILQELS